MTRRLLTRILAVAALETLTKPVVEARLFAKAGLLSGFCFLLLMPMTISWLDVSKNLFAQTAADKKKPMTITADQLKLLKTFMSEFVKITPGKGDFPKSFEMGSKEGTASEQPLHKVTFTHDFAMAKYEVPQNLYEAVTGANPSRWTGPRNSVEMMSWGDAMRFCGTITQMLKAAKLIDKDEAIRLPTEAEWEYCCRAGSTTAYSFGDSATQKGDQGVKASLLDPYGWHTGNAAGNDPPVGALKPNAWGLYDMHGYLWEFVLDSWHGDYKGAPTDGTIWEDGGHPVQRVMRSGSWRDSYQSLRSATRWTIPDHAKSTAIGFRCVKSTVKKQ